MAFSEGPRWASIEIAYVIRLPRDEKMHRFRAAPRWPALAPTLPGRRASRDVLPAHLALEDLGLLSPGVANDARAGDARDYPEEPLVLIVSRERASAVPRLRELLQGEPEISIVVDRRLADRRGPDGDVDPPLERRATERRRRFSFYLL